MSEYDKMRKSEELDDDGVDEEELSDTQKSDEDKYFEFYHDIKRTPKDDW